MSTLSILADASMQGVNLKEILLLVFLLGVIGALAWGVRVWAIPSPFSWLIYFVLAVVAVVMTYRFLQGL